MIVVLSVLGALGGLAAFAVSVVAVIRAIARQVGATEANTRALTRLSEHVDKIDGKVDQHGERIARLEGGGRR